MATKKRTQRRKGRRHRGVVLMRPEPALRIWWRARYQDPDDGKVVKETLPRELTTVEAREAWAVDKAAKLAERRAQLALGAARKTGTGLEDAVKRYFEAHKHLRGNTLSGYRAAADRLLAWAKKKKLDSADDVTRAVLHDLRAALISQPKKIVVEGGKRGEHENASTPRSPAAVNRDLRSLRALLGYLSELDLLPRLADGDLRRALKRLPLTSEHIEYLKPAEIVQLLDAAQRHDADVYVETRKEHRGLRPVGGTQKYEPIAPFLLCVLLSGMRFDEALRLDWRQVDLDALDSTSRKVGEIYLAGSGTKTKKARTIGLEVSPALRSLLAALGLQSGAKGSVFALSRGTAVAAAKRLRGEYGAPESFTWQALRRTCGTFLTNSPGIFGAASAYHSARQLGHSVKIAEQHYLGRERGIPRDAHTLEAAMQIEDLATRVILQARSACCSAARMRSASRAWPATRTATARSTCWPTCRCMHESSTSASTTLTTTVTRRSRTARAFCTLACAAC